MDRWGQIAWVAARQCGVVTLDQAVGQGVSPDTLQRRAREQRWGRPFPGVYVMPGHPQTQETLLMAGALYLGKGAAVARGSAAVLWELSEEWPSVPEYVLPHERRRARHANLTVIRTRTLTLRDVTLLGPIPVTRIDRTLCDLAAVLTEPELREAVARAGQRSLQWPRRAAARAVELDHLAGRARLLASVRDVLAEGRTDSALERRVRRVLRAAGLRPAPGVYPLVVGGRLIAMLDIALPELRVAIDADGFAHHRSPEDLRADHARQNRIQAAGWTVLRIGHPALQRDGGAELIAQITRIGASRL